jgi:hypothetical protein
LCIEIVVPFAMRVRVTAKEESISEQDFCEESLFIYTPHHPSRAVGQHFGDDGFLFVVIGGGAIRSEELFLHLLTLPLGLRRGVRKARV